MQKCKIDIDDILDKQGRFNFSEFFPLFRDGIFGITFLHGHYMAHRDIKPNNIMQLSKDTWRLLDYGIGENIKILAEHTEEIDT